MLEVQPNRHVVKKVFSCIGGAVLEVQANRHVFMLKTCSLVLGGQCWKYKLTGMFLC